MTPTRSPDLPNPPRTLGNCQSPMFSDPIFKPLLIPLKGPIRGDCFLPPTVASPIPIVSVPIKGSVEFMECRLISQVNVVYHTHSPLALTYSPLKGLV